MKYGRLLSSLGDQLVEGPAAANSAGGCIMLARYTIAGLTAFSLRISTVLWVPAPPRSSSCNSDLGAKCHKDQGPKKQLDPNWHSSVQRKDTEEVCILMGKAVVEGLTWHRDVPG